MKIDRLLGIITYLLNRDQVSGKQLADKFEVSERTIQRDIESINMAGIPILSLRGATGGYKILDTYRLSKQTATSNDVEAIRMALETLGTALHHENIDQTLEKVHSLKRSGDTSPISVDFGVAKENVKVANYLQEIEKAINTKKQIIFDYNNASNHKRQHQVEPVSLKFKWYAWYLAGYAIHKKEYRIYKLPRMTNLEVTEDACSNLPTDNKDLFEELIKKDTREFTKLIVKCKKEVFTCFHEHFHQLQILSEGPSYYQISLDIIESERLWFALMLSFGNDIKILEPQHIRERILGHGKNIIKNYEKPDR